MLLDGMGLEKDLGQALEWITKAVKQENPLAQRFLGNCYSEGLGLEADGLKSVEWLTRAAVHGNFHACRQLSDVLLMDVLMPKNERLGT